MHGAQASHSGVLTGQGGSLQGVRPVCRLCAQNPFYEVEMPIRCELFDQHLFTTITAVHRRWGLVH